MRAHSLNLQIEAIRSFLSQHRSPTDQSVQLSEQQLDDLLRQIDSLQETAGIISGSQLDERVQHQSQEKYRWMLESITDAYYAVDDEWRFLVLNPVAARDLFNDRPVEELLGKTMWEVYPQAVGGFFYEQYHRAVSTRQPVHFEAQSNLVDAWFEAHAYPREGFLEVYLRNITGRKQAEQEQERLLEENRRYTSLLEAIFQADPAGTAVVTGQDLRFAFTNPVFRMLSPQHLLDFTGKPFADAWSGAEYADFQAHITRVLETGRPFIMQGVERVFADGGRRIFNFQARRIEWDGQNAALLIFWDTTEAVQAQIALHQRSEELDAARALAEAEKNRLEAVMRALPIGLAITDAQGGAVQANLAYDQVWGSPRPDPQDVSDYSAYQAWSVETGDPLKPEEWASAQAVQKGEAVTGQVLEIQRFDGRRALVLNSAAPVRDSSGEIIGSAVVIQDITSLRDTERALQESQELFSKAFRASPDSLIISRMEDGLIVEVNESFWELFGYERLEVIGKTSIELNLFQDPGEREKAVEKLRQQGSLRDYELQVRTRWGNHRWARMSVERITIGQEDHLVTILHDITEQRKNQELLEYQGMLLMNIDDAVVASDENLWVTAWNKAAEKMYGWTAEEAIGHLVSEMIPSEWTDEQDQAAHRQLHETGEFVGSMVQSTREGRKLWVECHGITLRDKAGKITGYVSVNRDITERRRFEQSLQENERQQRELAKKLEVERSRLAAVLEHLPVGVWIIGPQGELVNKNMHADQVWGGDAPLLESIDQYPVYTAWWPETGEPLQPEEYPAARAVRTGQAVAPVEVRIRRFDGSEGRVLISAAPIQDQEGQQLGTVAINLDVSELKNMEQHLAYQAMVLENAHDAIISTDTKRRITSWNQAAEKLYGWTAQEAIGQPGEQLLRTEISDEQRVAIMDQLKETGFYSQEVIQYTRDGRQLVVEGTVITVRDALGEISGYVAANRDITERKRAEEALKQALAQAETSQRLLAALMEHVPEGITIADVPDVKIRMVSQHGQKLTGRSEAALSGIAMEAHPEQWQIYHLDGSTLAKPEELPLSRATLSGEVVTHEEWILRRPDGEDIIISCDAGPIRDGGGRITNGVIAWRDITGQKKAQQELQKAKEAVEQQVGELQAVFDAIGDPLLVYDPQGMPVKANLAAEQTFGFCPVGVPRETLIKKLNARDLSGNPLAVDQLPRSSALRADDVQEPHFSFRNARGETVFVQASASPIRDASGCLQGAVSIWYDVTERERILEEHQKQRRFLERLIHDAPVAIAVLQGSEHRYTLVNPQEERLTQGKGNLIGRTVAEVWPESAGEVLPLLDEVYQTGQPFFANDILFHMERDKGPEEAYFDVSYSPLYDEQGQVEGILALAAETTEQVQLRQQMEVERARLSAILANAPIAIVVSDAQAQVVYTNAVAEEIYKRPVPFGQDYQSHNQLHICYPDGTPYDPRDLPLTRSVLDGESFINLDLSILWPDGQKRELLVNTAPVLDKKGKISGAVGVFQDITQRKRTDAELRESEKRTREILESISDGFFSFDREWRMTYINERAAQQGGTRAEDLIGRVIWEAMPVLRGTHLEALYRQVMTERKPGTTEYHSPRSGRWFEVRVYPSAEGISVYTVDITERKQAEQALRESEARFRTLADNISQLVWMTDASGWIFWYNQRWYDYTSTTLEEMQGWGWQAVHHPEHVERVVAKFSRSIESGEVWEDTFPLRGKDGQYRWFLSRAIPIQDEQGQIVRWFGTNTDITEQREILEALQTSEERFRIALASAPIAVFSQDRDLRYTWIYQPQWGIGIEESIGKRDDELFPSEDVAELVALKQAALDLGKGVQQEIQVKTRTGYQDFMLSLEPLFDPSGKPSGLIGAAMDITELHRAEAEAIQNQTRVEVQRRLIEQREQERLQIARELHDGPLQELTGINFTLHGMINQVEDQELQSGLGSMQAAVKEMMNELRAYTNQLRPPLLIRFGLVKAIFAHAESFQERNPQIHLELEVEPLKSGLSELISLSVFRIYQESLNNILKHARASEVRVSLTQDGEGVCLEIQDNGVGFTLPRQWVELARKGHLGMVGMIERAEAVNGQLEVTSKAGEGTRICLRIPPQAAG